MRKTRKPLITAMCALVLALGVNATYAWLTDTTDVVTNTFTVGNIDITLTETDADNDGNVNSNSYKMVPGQEIAKDPKVTVIGGSEDCWLFVQIVESANFDEFMAYGIADGWTPLAGETGVYYYEVGAKSSDQEFFVLSASPGHSNGHVTVNEGVTKEMMDDIANGEVSNPTLTFTAYAVQKAGVETVADAWDKAQS